MKNLHLYSLIICCFFFSCSEFEDDINVNPNLPSQASGTQLIANAQLYLPGLASSPKGEFMAQYLSETQYVGLSLYPEESTSFYGYYQGPLENLQTVLNSDDLGTVDGPVANQKAIAKILKAYFFWNLTDRWGDIPYSEALQGADNLTPVYDTQEFIYNDLFAELKEANSMMVSGDIENDIMFDGDMDQWRKFANTVRLLMALRLSEVDSGKAQEEFNSALADGVFESNNDNFTFQHLSEANNQNYWYDQVIESNREWWALSEDLVEDLKPVDDPRLEVYGDPARATGEYIGLKFGEEDNIGTEEFSLLGSDIIAQDAPVYLVTYAQVLFAKAEASARGWISEDAEMNYNEAIRNSIIQWTGSDEGVDEFLAQDGITFDSDMAIEQISNQRWVHLFMFGYEAWAEIRRTGYPDDLEMPNGNAIPNRLAYPDNEGFNNTDNFQDAVQRQFGGDDSIYGKVWWDVD